MENFHIPNSYWILDANKEPLKEHATFYENRLIFQLPNS